MNLTPDLSKEFHPVPKPLKRVKIPKNMKTEGKKTIAWTDKRNELKEEFYKMKIVVCELRYVGCWRNTALGFAHAKKRRKLTTEDLGSVALICNPCHAILEVLPPEEMERIVMNIIKRRKTSK